DLGLTRFAKVRFSTPEKREAWLDVAERLGSNDAGLRHRRPASLETASSAAQHTPA
ncbi:MAG: hypothetical protein HGA44_17855, partial [Cellulomonadaceae bacterium]|nr:hypothetical protein [Cellulomonadaceae bacterium]